MMFPTYLPSRSNKITPLPSTFLPGDHDVICGRGKGAHAFPGNRRFRLAIWINMGRYYYTKSKFDKSIVVACLVDDIRAAGGRFVKPVKGEYVDIGDQVAREKTGHALRDAISALLAAQNKVPDKNNTTVSMDDLMDMPPQVLEELEDTMHRDGSAPVSCRTVKKKSKNARSSAANKKRHDSPPPPVVNTKQNTSSVKRRRPSVDPFTPIKLEDLLSDNNNNNTDMSLLNMFAESVHRSDEETMGSATAAAQEEEVSMMIAPEIIVSADDAASIDADAAAPVLHHHDEFATSLLVILSNQQEGGDHILDDYGLADALAMAV